MVDTRHIKQLLKELSNFGATGDEKGAAKVLAELVNAVPSLEMNADIAKIDLDAVKAALDVNGDGTFSASEIVAFANDHDRLNPALAHTSFAGEVFKSATEMALAQKDDACSIDPGEYEKERRLTQIGLNVASYMPNFVVAKAIETEFNKTIRGNPLTFDGKANAWALSSSAAELMGKFDKIELPRLDQICQETQTADVTDQPVKPAPKPRNR
ncbi:MAG: hypothetical protein U1E36_05260 [Rickettsiales bacterium]